MFGSTALALPPPFAIDHHHPLRVSSEPSRPQPSGGCNFLLVQPSAKSKICACQVYHHNRSAPGNVCDCGHPACFHIHSFGEKAADSAQGLKLDAVDRIRKLEDIILAERRARESDRLEWQRETRALREALAPFYRIEDEMQRKLVQMDARLHLTTEQQRRLDDVVKKLEHVDVTQPYKSADSVHHIPPMYGRHLPPLSQVGDYNPGLTSSDERSSASSFSRHQTPSETMLTVAEPDSPRSSGILNLACQPRPTVPPNNYVVTVPVSQAQEEPRSSGFLGVNVRDHRAAKVNRKRQHSSPASSAYTDSTELDSAGPRKSKSPRHETPYGSSSLSNRALSSTISPRQDTPPTSLSRPSPPANGHIDSHHLTKNTSQASSFRRNRAGDLSGPATGSDVPFLALDVLADVSTATNGLS